MTNQINAKGKYKEQIEDLKESIELLKESDNLLGFEDDGSGEEYTSMIHQKGRNAKEKALDCIIKACNVIMNEVD